MVEFARWVDAFCPPNNQLGAEPIVCCTRESQDCSAVMRLHYATNYSDASHLRPYMCAWRADTGCSGFFEPDLALMLMELILSEGCPGHLNLIYSVCVTKPKKTTYTWRSAYRRGSCLIPTFLAVRKSQQHRFLKSISMLSMWHCRHSMASQPETSV